MKDDGKNQASFSVFMYQQLRNPSIFRVEIGEDTTTMYQPAVRVPPWVREMMVVVMETHRWFLICSFLYLSIPNLTINIAFVR